jgi:branched-chain amino acid transport system substrate-binding protein
MNEFKAKYNDDFYTGSTIRIFETLGAAMAKAKSTDPVKVAAALEGLKVKSFNGEVEMRKADHQLQQPLYMTVWQKADKKYPYSPENTGMTLVPAEGIPQLRVQHAHQLPDEAPLIAGGVTNRSPYGCTVSGSFF